MEEPVPDIAVLDLNKRIIMEINRQHPQPRTNKNWKVVTEQNPHKGISKLIWSKEPDFAVENFQYQFTFVSTMNKFMLGCKWWQRDWKCYHQFIMLRHTLMFEKVLHLDRQLIGLWLCSASVDCLKRKMQCMVTMLWNTSLQLLRFSLELLLN